MKDTLEEMMRSYVDEYMNTEEGKKLMLKSMIHMFNERNCDRSNSLFNQNKIDKFAFEELKHIITKISTLSSPDTCFLPTEQIKTLCDSVIQISDLLDKIAFETVTHQTINSHIDKIYQSASVFKLKPRELSLEDFLGTDISKSETNSVFQEKSSFTPPERAQESKLKKYGYSVAWNDPLSNKERQALLKKLIETGKVSKGYVIGYLKHNIQINGKKKHNEFAVSKWKDDLDFVYKL